LGSAFVRSVAVTHIFVAGGCCLLLAAWWSVHCIHESYC